MRTSYVNVPSFHLQKFDSRIRPLLMFLRYFSRRHGVSGGGMGNKMTHYAYTFLVLFYLQTEGLFPSVKAFQVCTGLGQTVGPRLRECRNGKQQQEQNLQ